MTSDQPLKDAFGRLVDGGRITIEGSGLTISGSAITAPKLVVPNPTHQHTIQRLSAFEMPLHRHAFVDEAWHFDRGYLDQMIYNQLITKDGSLKTVLGFDPAKPTIKENHMSQTRLLTPSETIERKDLAIAIAISDARSEDELMHAVALVQDLTEGQSISRGFYVKKQEVLDRHIKVINGPEGFVTDVKLDEQFRGNDIEFVLDGKMVKVDRSVFIVIEPASYQPKPSGVAIYQSFSNTPYEKPADDTAAQS